MEKEDAIEFILRELANDRSQAEIVSMLSQELGAPQPIVENFVSRVLAEHRPAPARSKLPAPHTPLITDLEAEEALKEQEEMSPASPIIEQTRPEVPTIPADQSPAYAPIPQVSQPNPESQFAPTASHPPQLDEQTEKIILKGLSKNRRMDDIVIEVCEETGTDWKQAQRMVAQVQAKNRKRLTSRRNAFLLPLAFVMVAAGLVLLWASGSEIQNLAGALLERDFSDPSMFYLEDTVRFAPAYFITGLVLVLGGIVGMFTALRAQME